MADYVIAIQSGAIEVDGLTQSVRLGDLFESDHPAVKQFPHLFGPVTLRFPVKRKGGVEQATAAPGEKRKR